MSNSFNTHDKLCMGDTTYRFVNLKKLNQERSIAHLPFSLKIVLENLLRHEDDGTTVGPEQIEALMNWSPYTASQNEISFMPARVVLQDFTGVPCIVDLAAMRDAVVKMGGDAQSINPQIPSELVIDHSIQVDTFGRLNALQINGEIEFERNKERYEFLRWGQQAFDNLKVVPPNTGIVHQVNLEHLARVVMARTINGEQWVFPDTVFGTDSHTTMVNGLGVLGWGVGGIEAEAAMLGEPSSMLIPDVVGVKLYDKLQEGVTATDLVLTITQQLRQLGVVGKFVEFYGPGLHNLSLADRATIANMAPEYGATCGLFPIDQETVNYLRLSGRSEEHITLVETYAKAQGLWHDENSVDAQYSKTLSVDLHSITPSVAGPKRPQDRLELSDVSSNFAQALPDLARRKKDRSEQAHEFKAEGGAQEQSSQLAQPPTVRITLDEQEYDLHDGTVVIAAITSCTNTSNPSVMLAAGLLAQNAAKKGLQRKPWVKTSLAPGSKVVTDYLKNAGVLKDLETLGFYVVGYGCTTCIGNSGPLPEAVSQGIAQEDLVVASVLSGNRNFEGRVHPEVKANYLASPPLVVAYALAGRVDIDLTAQPLGQDQEGNDVYLKDIWPTAQDIGNSIAQAVHSEMFTRNYANVFEGDTRWNSINVPDGNVYAWGASTYIKNPPYFENLQRNAGEIHDVHSARVLGVFGDSITTDHISPAGAIKADSPAGRYLQHKGVEPKDFNSYGSRRGNDEIMVRGTFANIRIKNLALDNVEGGFAPYYGKDNEILPIFDAAMRYKNDNVPLIVFAGKEYGTGSSRDWAAKGTLLLGVKAVIAESFERIHRSNLVGMGVLPCRFKNGQNVQNLGLDGSELIDLYGVEEKANSIAHVRATKSSGEVIEFDVDVLMQTPNEVQYMKNGGLLPYVLRKLV